MSENQLSLYGRYEFLIRRIHSLCGLIPVGAYMVIHLATNASILNGVETFQNLVYQIHSLGKILWIVEWGFIFLPLLFHGLFGVVIIFGGKSNISNYPTTSNLRYTLQRASGMVALLFIFYHVFHMHGWFHFEFWKNLAHGMGMAQFSPYNAASTAANALQSSFLVPVLYFIGILACVYHFANGIWTMGITWGVWTSPKAQNRASILCAGLGVFVMAIATSALVGFCTLDEETAREREQEMYMERVKDGSVTPNLEKLSEETRNQVEKETAGRR